MKVYDAHRKRFVTVVSAWTDDVNAPAHVLPVVSRIALCGATLPGVHTTRPTAPTERERCAACEAVLAVDGRD